ncbi:hypothetical protein Tco_0385127 [Tanacetum coccineum]
MYKKSTKLSKSTSFSLTVTCSYLEYIQNLLNEPHVQELTDLMCKPVYTDAHITFEVANLEGNPEEMFADDIVHQISSSPAKTTHNLVTNPQHKSFQAKAKMLMAKAKHNMRKITFKKAVEKKFKEYNQKLEAVTLINVPKAIEEAIQAKNKSFKNNDTRQKLYNTLYESITLDQEALDAQDTEPSFNKRSHNDQDPPNDREGDTRKKRRKDVCEPSSRSSKKDKDHVVLVQEDTLAYLPQDQEEYHILGPSTIDVAKKLKELIQKDELTLADPEGVGLEKLKEQYKNDVELEYHVDQLKAAVLTEAQWSNGEGDASKPRSFK